MIWIVPLIFVSGLLLGFAIAGADADLLEQHLADKLDGPLA